MAQRYVTDEGVLVIPGAYPSTKVQKNNSGLATSGVIFLVGEADAGPAWSDEQDLSTNFFGPTELSEVMAKYKSGNLVDAFRAAVNAAKDPNIQGAPAAVYLVKTNVSTRAQRQLLAVGGGNYAMLRDRAYGALGNMTYVEVKDEQAEVAPSVTFVYAAPAAAVTLAVAVNGVISTVNLVINETQAAFITKMQAVAGLAVTSAGSNVTIAVSGAAVGGKSLEIAEVTGSAESFAQNLDASEVTWVSKTSAPKLITSAAERRAALYVKRQADGTDDKIVAGGDVVLRVGYQGTTATLTIGAQTFSTTVTGGAGASIPATALAGFKRISDLAAFINAQPGYTASVGSALYGQLPVSALDQGTYAIASQFKAATGRIKKDAYDFQKRIAEGTRAVELTARAAAGLPAVAGVAYLTGGTKGATTAAGVTSAIQALTRLRGNFVVPLFSQDAAADKELGLTETLSDYTISAIHEAVSGHVLEMSKLKRRRHRQGFLSYKGSFAAAQLVAQNVANYRCAMTFQDVRTLDSQGVVKQFQPWMGAVLAAGTQAAGFYRAIVHKGVNCSGVLVADGSFTDQDDADLEKAIENGLLVMERPESGGIRFNSDQTTYATDESFVFNSIQAIYTSDIIALTVAQRMEKAFVGQSIADVSASMALSYLSGIMADMKRLKLIAGSDDAPAGYKNARIVISGNAMKVEVEIKLAGTILFIPISFLVTQVTQAAG